MACLTSSFFFGCDRWGFFKCEDAQAPQCVDRGVPGSLVAGDGFWFGVEDKGDLLSGCRKTPRGDWTTRGRIEERRPHFRVRRGTRAKNQPFGTSGPESRTRLEVWRPRHPTLRRHNWTQSLSHRFCKPGLRIHGIRT